MPTQVPPRKMNATMPERNGERSRLPFSGLRRKPSAGAVPQSRKAPNTAIRDGGEAEAAPLLSDSSSMAVERSSPCIPPAGG